MLKIIYININKHQVVRKQTYLPGLVSIGVRVLLEDTFDIPFGPSNEIIKLYCRFNIMVDLTIVKLVMQFQWPLALEGIAIVTRVSQLQYSNIFQFYKN